MRFLVLILCAIVGLVLVTGCTTTPPTVVEPVPTTRETPPTLAPVTTTPTSSPATTVPTFQTNIDPEALPGKWYLEEKVIRGAPANLTYWDTRVFVVFESGGRVYGNDGCNNFWTSYTAGGRTLTIGPGWQTTLMYCPQDPGTSFTTIFMDSASYGMIPPGKLIISDTKGNSLIFNKIPPVWDPKDLATITYPAVLHVLTPDCDFIKISDRYGQTMQSDLKELRAALASNDNETARHYAMNISANSKSVHDILVELPVTDNLTMLQAASMVSIMDYQLGADMVLDRLDAKPPRYEFSFYEPLDQGDELYSIYMSTRDNLTLKC